MGPISPGRSLKQSGNGPSLPRLYGILDVDVLAARGLDPITVLDIWIAAGVRLVQLRAKSLAGGPFLDVARAMATRLNRVGGLSIVNDRADIARLAAASGVHVGQDDLAAADARSVAGAGRIVGLSTHTDQQVEQALPLHLDYIAIGPVFPTRTKGRATAEPVGLTGVRSAVARSRSAGLPVVAIGGIDLENAREVLAAGAASVAVISDLLRGDPAVRVQEYREALDLPEA